jgi:nucleotide-binding universal stress UspA family protein
MTAVLIVLVVLLGTALAVVLARRRPQPRSQSARMPGDPARRILFPFVATALSQRALDAALRLARAEGATLVPVFLARVPLTLPLDAPLPRQSQVAIPLQEAIEQRAVRCGVPVDARVERGRTERHALRQTIAHERFDRIVIAAAPHGGHGFDPDDVAWLLDHAPGEIVVLRPGAEDPLAAPGLPLSAQVPDPAATPRPATPPPPVLSRAA